MIIDTFQGRHAFLSNFHPVEVELDGAVYPSVEHAYQAAKSSDSTYRRRVALTVTPRAAKKLGKRIKTLDPDWESVKITVMRDLLAQKFKKGSSLANQLVATAPRELIKGNRWGDTFWGVCRGVGQNHLGKLLMERRAIIIGGA